MNTEHWIERLSPQEYAALFDAARQRAHELRIEALRDFWDGLAQGVRRGWQTIRRAAPASPPHPPRSTSACPR
jgi:hypothetical protein